MALTKQINDTRGLYVVTDAEPKDTPTPPVAPWTKARLDVMSLSFLNANAKLVYFALAECDGPLGCFPGRDRIASMTGLHKKTVDRSILVLVDCGLISIKRRGKTQTNTYSFCPISEWHESPKSESPKVSTHPVGESPKVSTHESPKVSTHSNKTQVNKTQTLLLHAADADAADAPDAVEDDDAPDPVEQDFEHRFWSVYPTRVNPSGRKVKGSRQASLKAWHGMSKRQRDLAILAIPDYLDAKNGMPNDAEKYLNKRMYLEHLPAGVEPSGKVDLVAQELATLREDQRRGRYAGRMEDFYAAEDAINARMVQR